MEDFHFPCDSLELKPSLCLSLPCLPRDFSVPTSRLHIPFLCGRRSTGEARSAEPGFLPAQENISEEQGCVSSERHIFTALSVKTHIYSSFCIQ